MNSEQMDLQKQLKAAKAASAQSGGNGIDAADTMVAAAEKKNESLREQIKKVNSENVQLQMANKKLKKKSRNSLEGSPLKAEPEDEAEEEEDASLEEELTLPCSRNPKLTPPTLTLWLLTP